MYNCLSRLLQGLPITSIMRVTVSSIRDGQVWFNIPQPIPEVIRLPYFTGLIAPGSIPNGVKQVSATSHVVRELLPGAIPDSVTHLYLIYLSSKIVIPATVKHLFVLDFKADMIAFVPDTVTHLYIHNGDRKQAPPDREHYLYTGALISIEKSHKDQTKYVYSEEHREYVLDKDFLVVKRTPKAMPLTITVGKTYTDLVISDSVTDTLNVPGTYRGLLRSGSIPKRITKVIFCDFGVKELEQGVITDSVTHLSINSLTAQMVIPPSVKHLAVTGFGRDMIKYVPSTVSHLYVYAPYRDAVPKDRVHYVFHLLDSSQHKLKTLENEGFDVSRSFDEPFKHMKLLVKRVPVETLVSKATSQEVPVGASKASSQEVPTDASKATPHEVPVEAAPNTCACSNQVLTKIAGLEEQLATLTAAVKVLSQTKSN